VFCLSLVPPCDASVLISIQSTRAWNVELPRALHEVVFTPHVHFTVEATRINEKKGTFVWRPTAVKKKL